MKKDDEPDTWAGINNYNFYDRHTYGHIYIYMTDPAQRAKSLKMKEDKIYLLL